ncbi:glycosyltransferase family 4 protein [Defluviitalea saccharophila]|uniref:Glycosyltransferase family 4 protein n=1 Tax=Defluviitalea saccharophila TaxID=879970 RepID=A0ABZ2Y309_9FIRM
MKKILMVLNYFYPEYASTGQLMTELCREIQNEFHITVIAAMPSYTAEKQTEVYNKIQYDQYENIRIIRVPVTKIDKTNKKSRLKYIFSYFINALKVILKEEKYDIIFTISQPPILGGWLGTLGKLLKRNKLIYCIEDFNPEQIEAVGYSKKKWLTELARYLDNLTCKYADQIIVVGRDMKSTLLKRISAINEEKISVINNWINEEEVYPLTKDHFKVQEFINRHNLSNKFIIMYSGNIGLYYDLENIIKVIEKFKTYQDMQFVFIGEGAKKQELIQYVETHRMENVLFLPYQPKEDIIYSLNAADLHLVTNQKGIKGVSVPSKIYGVMAVGKTILGILEKDSEAEILIRESQCGIVVDPQDYKSIEESIRNLYNHREQLESIGVRGRKYLEEHLKMKDSIDMYRKLFHKI